MYESNIHSFVVSDYIAVFNQNGTNFTSIKVNENGMFNITVNDEDLLSSYIFSLKNSSSDNWYNYSAVDISGRTSYFANTSHIISSTNGQTAQWKYYVNDSNGTMYESYTHSFAVSN